MSGGSKPVKPEKPVQTELERVQLQLAKDRQSDFETRYLPVEQMLRDRTKVLGSDQAYQRSMAEGQSAAAAQAGGQARQGALLAAMGRGGAGATGLSPNAYTNLAQQEAAHRGNWLNQTTGVAGLGAGVNTGALGAYNSAVNFDRQAANRTYADAVGHNNAQTASRLATLNAIGETAVKAGTMYATGGFGG